MDYIYELKYEPFLKLLNEHLIKNTNLNIKLSYRPVSDSHNNHTNYDSSGILDINVILETRGWGDYLDFYISEFPQNCAWLVLRKLNWKNSKLQLEITELIAKYLKYSAIMISCSEEQSDTMKFFLENGFVEIFRNRNFHSQRHEVFLLIKEMEK